MDQNAFISSLLPHAMEASKRTGVDPRIIIAQAANESAWGNSAPGNNYFGIKSHGQSGGNTLATTEVVNGQPVRTKDSFRAYNDPAESVKGYADFILQNPRYSALRSAKGLDAQLAALQESGYATDPNYSKKVGSIASGITINDDGTASYNGQTISGGGGGADTLVGGAGSDDLGGGGAKTTAAPTPAPEPSLGAKFLAGGPGALFGAPQEGWNLGDGLMGLGAALSARDNPSAGYALAQMLKSSRDKAKEKVGYDSLGYSPNKKQMILQDRKTGQITYQDLPEGATKTDPEQADDKMRAAFGANNKIYGDSAQLAEDTHLIRDAIANKGLRFNAFNNIEDAFKNFSGNSDETSRVRAAVDRLKQQMILMEQLKQKGVQTEGDAQRMLQAYWPSSVNYDSALALQNLDRLHDAARKDMANYGSMNKKSIERYKELDDGVGIDGSPLKYSQKYDTDLKHWDEVNKQFAPARDNFLKTYSGTKTEGPSLNAYEKWKKERESRK